MRIWTTNEDFYNFVHFVLRLSANCDFSWSIVCNIIFFDMQNDMLELQNVFWIVPMCERAQMWGNIVMKMKLHHWLGLPGKKRTFLDRKSVV